MPYQPTYPYPYMDTIDVEKSEGNDFKCLINSKDTILGATINITKNNNFNSDVLIMSGTPSTVGNSDISIPYSQDIYDDLNIRLNDNENLILRISSEYRKIGSISFTTSNNTRTRIIIRLTEVFSGSYTTSNTYYIYTDVAKKISLPEELFPFVSDGGDGSWLQYNVDSVGLHNGLDYKWSINLIFDTYEQIYLGYIQNTGFNYIDILYDDSIFDRISSKIKKNQDCYLVANSEKYKITSVDKKFLSGINVLRVSATTDLSFAAIITQGDWCEIYTDVVSLTSPEYYFKARTTPDIIFDVPKTISNSVYTFEAIYSQKQKIGIAYFQYDLHSNGELIASSGQVFSQKISYTFESFVSGTPYSIKLTIVNNDGIEIETEREFTVEYEIFASIISPVISVNNFKACANVDFSNNASIPSTLIGSSDTNYKVFDKPDYKTITNGHLVSCVSPTTLTIQPYDNILIGMYLKIEEELRKIIKIETDATDNIIVSIEEGFTTNPSFGDEYEICSYFNGINLNEQQTILWDNIGGNPLDIPEKSTQVVHWHASHGFSGLILEKVDFDNPEKSTYVSYNGGMFTYEIGSKKVVYNPYLGTASAIAGRDEYSAKGTVIEYSSNSIVLESSPLINVGKIIQIGTERRIIKSVTVNQDNTTVGLDRAFTSTSSDSTNSYVVYDENYLYVLSNDDELQDTDILIDSDLTYNYWWLIVLLPDEVQFIKTTSFTESEV